MGIYLFVGGILSFVIFAVLSLLVRDFQRCHKFDMALLEILYVSETHLKADEIKDKLAEFFPGFKDDFFEERLDFLEAHDFIKSSWSYLPNDGDYEVGYFLHPQSPYYEMRRNKAYLGPIG